MEGGAADSMVIYLEGETDGRRESAGPDAPVYTARAGKVTGMLPFSRMTHYTITARAVSHLRVARIAKASVPGDAERGFRNWGRGWWASCRIACAK